MSPQNLPDIPQSLRDEIAQKKIIPFVGPSVSRNIKSKEFDAEGKNQALFPNWKALLLSAADLLDQEEKGNVANLIRSQLEMRNDENKGEYYFNAAKQAQKHLGTLWLRLFREQLNPQRSQVENSTLNIARAMWKLNSQLIITTNYDKALHWVCPEKEREDLQFWDIDSIYSQTYSLEEGNQRPTVLHLHGHINNVNNLVLAPQNDKLLYPTKGNLQVRYQTVLEILKSYLFSKSLLFLGFNFEDQSFFKLISESIIQGSTVPHYILAHQKQKEFFQNLGISSLQPIYFQNDEDLEKILLSSPNTEEMPTKAGSPFFKSKQFIGLAILVAAAPIAVAAVSKLKSSIQDDSTNSPIRKKIFEEKLKLRRVTFENYRQFSDMEVNLHESLTVLVGENGVGKTSFLDGIALGLSPIIEHFWKNSGKKLQEKDLHQIGVRQRASKIVIHLQSLSSLQWQVQYPKIENTQPVPLEKEFLSPISEHLSTGKKVQLPVIVHYQANRLATPLSEKNANEGQIGRTYIEQRLDALNGALEADINFQETANWFYSLEIQELREKRDREDFHYENPMLSVVRFAITQILPTISKPRFLQNPLRLVVDQKEGELIKTMALDQLSSGYQSILALVFDLARRMSQANPEPYQYQENQEVHKPEKKNLGQQILETNAIILIDEIDLHLHPRWQQQILQDLQKVFPNTQFIVTTHSPQVLTTVPPECIRLLTNQEEKLKIITPNSSYGAESSRLLKDVLGVSPRPKESSEQLAEYFRWIGRDDWDHPDAQALREKIESWSRGEEPKLGVADMMIHRRKHKLEKEK